MSRIDTEIAILQRSLDRALDRCIDLEYENAELRKTLELYEWNATIEAWDEAWAREWETEQQLQLPFETVLISVERN